MRNLWNKFLGLLPAYHDINILMEGGHVINVRCTSYSFTKNTETGAYTAYNFGGMRADRRTDWGIRLDKMVGWTKHTKLGYV